MGRTRDRTSIGLWSVVSIGVGGMVGGGIFAVLGLSAQLARGGAPVAFAIGGIVAGLTQQRHMRSWRCGFPIAAERSCLHQ